MNEQCKFTNAKGYRCGSYAFNLYTEQIDQGDRCDHHYWQDRAVKAEALVDAARADEREECAKACDEIGEESDAFTRDILRCTAAAIRARGAT
jgi:hypothetical protein